MYEKAIPDPTAIDGMKLWDEILKAIVSAIPTVSARILLCSFPMLYCDCGPC